VLEAQSAGTFLASAQFSVILRLKTQVAAWSSTLPAQLPARAVLHMPGRPRVPQVVPAKNTAPSTIRKNRALGNLRNTARADVGKGNGELQQIGGQPLDGSVEFSAKGSARGATNKLEVW